MNVQKAIEANPLAGEAWKRRGQARAALGDSNGVRHNTIISWFLYSALRLHCLLSID